MNIIYEYAPQYTANRLLVRAGDNGFGLYIDEGDRLYWVNNQDTDGCVPIKDDEIEELYKRIDLIL